MNWSSVDEVSVRTEDVPVELEETEKDLHKKVW